MWKGFAKVAWLALALFCLAPSAQAQNTLLHAGSVKAPSGGSGSCAASSAWFARTSGLSGTEHNAYDTMICGMVSDGNGCSAWSGSSGTMDGLYIFATNTTTTANLNLCGSSFGLTQNGSVMFTADHGYTGDGTSGYFAIASYDPFAGGVNWTQNSGSVGAYVLNNRTTTTTVVEISGDDGGAGGLSTYIAPLQSSGNDLFCLDCSAGWTSTSTTAQGQYVLSRTSSVLQSVYKNGTAGSTNAVASSAAPGTVTIMADAPHSQYYTVDQVSAAWMGGGVNSTQAGQIASRINAFMTALGINVY